MRALLARRDARVLVFGQLVSMFGDSAMFLVLGIWAKTLTGSNAAAGLVFFVLIATTLAAPLGGLIADRVRRRPLMIVVDVGLAGSMLLLLFVHGREQLWLIYVVAALYGLGFGIAGAARSALLRVMLPEELLADANAALQTGREGLRLVAPLAGAGLFAAVGGGAVAVVDAATFLVSAATLVALRVREPDPEPAEHRFLVEAAAGVRHIFRTPMLRMIVLNVALALLVVGFAETLIFAVLDQGLHRPVSFFGVLSSLQGVGAIAGGLTAAPLLRRVGDARLVGIGLLAFAVGDLSFVSSSLPLVLVGFAVAGAGIAWAIVAFGTALQLRTPLRIQGRVSAAADMLIGVPQTVSIATGAALSTIVDYRLLVLVMAVVTAACGLALARTTPAELSPEASPSEAR
jgi:MFS family permease